MNFKNILFRTFAATALIWAVACEKLEPNNGSVDSGNEGVAVPGVSEINGTVIQEGNTLVGLVSDSNTSKGIAGVVVSDGYSVVKTDENGVYQFKANRYAKTVFVSIPAEYQVPMDEKKQPVFWEISDPKPPVIRSGHLEDKRQ
jgi:hypothetical protein